MTERWQQRDLANSFGEQAGLYERARPDYPDAAVTWLVGAARRVADVGAGTGKLTRVLRRLGREVVAVEPDAAMRAELVAAVPGVEVLAGTGEALPLPDTSVDAVTFGQAWHWVDPAAGSIEAARVLRPGGVLGLVWNARDQQTDRRSRDVRDAVRDRGLAHHRPGRLGRMIESPEQYLDAAPAAGRPWLTEFWDYVATHYPSVPPVMFRQTPMYRFADSYLKGYVMFTTAAKHFSAHAIDFDLVQDAKDAIEKSFGGKGCVSVKYDREDAKPAIRAFVDAVMARHGIARA